MEQDIWVLAEHREGELEEVTKELLGEGQELAEKHRGKLCSILLGQDVEKLALYLGQYGADRVFLVEDKLLSVYTTDAYSIVLENLLRRYKPFFFLCGATPLGQDLTPRLAIRLGAPLATNCILIKNDGEGNIIAVRPACQGKTYQTLIFPADKTGMATLQPGARGVDEPDTTRTAEVTRVKVELNTEAIRTKHLSFIPPNPRTMDIAEASMIVAGGRGLGNAEEFQLLSELADLIGAGVGGTKVAIDRGWLPRERMIGSTGKTVKPKLYLACGISGASQHIVGMKDSEWIIAINSDPSAPIFSLADLAVLGDLHQIVPEIIHRLRNL